MKQRAAIRENGSGGGGIPRPNTTASSSNSNTASPSKLAVRTNSRLLVGSTAGGRQEPLGRTLSGGGGEQTAGSDSSKGAGGLQVLDAGYKPIGGGGVANYLRGGGVGGQRALVSDKLYPR